MSVSFRFIAAVLATLLTMPVEAAVLIVIDKTAQSMTVEVDGTPRYQWPISSGRRGYATPRGTYTPFRMEEDHYSREWDDAPMPHSIFFTRIGHAIHGTLEVKRLGTAASHGCVRLEPANAATLFALVRSEGLKNTKVVVTGVEPAAVAGQRQGLPRDVGSGVAATRNWDNTVAPDNRPPWERQAPPLFGGAPQAWPPPQRF